MKITYGMDCNPGVVMNITCEARNLTKLHLVVLDNDEPRWLATVNGIRALPPTVTEILLAFFMVPLDFEKGVAELWDIR